MKLSEIKTILPRLENVAFHLEDGTPVPAHFHITEIGMVTKQFMDCGGTIRNEKLVNFQLWNANDLDHRLKPTKFLHIIQLSEMKLDIEDVEVEVEYQTDTIGKYDLDFNGNYFVLKAKSTDCLAQENCGMPKEKIELKELSATSCCTPNSGCC